MIFYIVDMRIPCSLIALCCLLHLQNGKTIAKRGVPDDWRELIGDDVFEYHTNNAESHAKDDLFENDITGIDVSVINKVNLSAALAHNAIPNKDQLWPNAIIPYKFKAGFSEEEQLLIERALRHIELKTCLKFIQRQSQQSYITFKKSSRRCSSYIGRISRQQDIFLKSGCINHIGEVQHEVMHALGFFHEQSRTDRDNYITIIWENIKEGQEDQFQKYRGDHLDYPYDYNSIMHYGWNAFSVDKHRPTILPRMATAKKVSIGNRVVMSPLDVQKINILYQCSGSESTSPSSEQSSQPKQPRKHPQSWRFNIDDWSNDTLAENNAGNKVNEKQDSDDIYRVRLGDTAYNIAMAHGMQLDRLRQLNPEKTDFDHIEPGDIFKVA